MTILRKPNQEQGFLNGQFLLAMPGMNGAELAQAVRRRYPALPVVFVTGYAEIGGLDADEAFIVQKPYRSDELAEKLQHAFASGKPN